MIINLNVQWWQEKAIISRQHGKEKSIKSGKIYTFLTAKKSIYINIIKGCLSTLWELIVEMQVGLLLCSEKLFESEKGWMKWGQMGSSETKTSKAKLMNVYLYRKHLLVTLL